MCGFCLFRMFLNYPYIDINQNNVCIFGYNFKFIIMKIELISADVSKYEAIFQVLENGVEKEIYCQYEVELAVSYCAGDYWTPPCRDIEGFEVYVIEVLIDGDYTKNQTYFTWVEEQLNNHVEANLTNYDN